MKLKRSVKSNLVVAVWIFVILLLIYFSVVTISRLTGNSIIGNVILDGRELNSGIISYYSFDDGTANDQSINKYNGVFRNGANVKTTEKTVPGKFGDGAYFDGVNDFILIDNLVFKKGDKDKGEGTDFSISLWAKPYFDSKTTTTFPNRGILFWMEKVGDFSQGYFGLTQNTQEGATAFLLDSSNGNYWAYDTVQFNSQEGNIGVNKWYNIVAVFSASTERISLYVNGVKISEKKINSEGPLGNGRLWIGKMYNDYYKGVIDEVKIYDRTLTESQIASIYQEGATCSVGQEFQCPSGYELIHASNSYGLNSYYSQTNCGGKEYFTGTELPIVPFRSTDGIPLCVSSISSNTNMPRVYSSKINGQCTNFNIPLALLTLSPNKVYSVEEVGSCVAPSAPPEPSPCTSDASCSVGETCNLGTRKCVFSGFCPSGTRFNCPSGFTEINSDNSATAKSYYDISSDCVVSEAIGSKEFTNVVPYRSDKRKVCKSNTPFQAAIPWSHKLGSNICTQPSGGLIINNVYEIKEGVGCAILPPCSSNQNLVCPTGYFKMNSSNTGSSSYTSANCKSDEEYLLTKFSQYMKTPLPYRTNSREVCVSQATFNPDMYSSRSSSGCSNLAQPQEAIESFHKVIEGICINNCIDADGDGYNKSAIGCGVADCYDANDTYGPDMSPGISEWCDGLDNDCDGVTDDNYICPVGSYYCDNDEDGFFGVSATGVCTTYDCNLGVAPIPGCVFEVGDDCRDNDSEINPNGAEICENGIDDDCSGGDASCDDICTPGDQKCEGTKIYTCGANSLWDSGVNSVVCGYNPGNGGNGGNGGGGGNGGSCSPLWRCTTWSNSEENCGTRTCSISNNCRRQIGKPLESLSCEDGGGTEPFCGNGVCDNNEDSIECRIDCPINFECGDGICQEDMGETLNVCEEDCRVKVTNPWIFWTVFILIIIGIGIVGYLIYYQRKKTESFVQPKSI